MLHRSHPDGIDRPFPRLPRLAELSVWFTVFLFGWLFLADPRFLSAVRAQAGTWLVAASIGFRLLLATTSAGTSSAGSISPPTRGTNLLFQILCGIHTWAWLLGITGMALRRLNFTGTSLDYAGRLCCRSTSFTMLSF